MRNWTRRGALLGTMGLLACTPEEQQAIFEAVLGGAGPIGTSGAGGLTQADAAAGLRAALNQGIGQAVAQVAREGGYFNDPQIKIPLPASWVGVQTTLAPYGLSGLLDQAERQLNRAAEQAAPEAIAIFADAIRTMSISDAIAIVRGSNTAATDYLQRASTTRLTSLFTPPMQSAVQATGLSQTLAQIDAQLRQIPTLTYLVPQLGAQAQDELVSHGVSYALDGLFYYVGQEEAAIRRNPAKRTSEILRRVFG